MNESRERLGCRRCGHEDSLAEGQSVAEGIYSCDVCRARIAFGVLVPRTAIAPHPSDPRLVVLQFDSLPIVMDRHLAREFAMAVLSVCPA